MSKTQIKNMLKLYNNISFININYNFLIMLFFLRNQNIKKTN